jgi:hypothetical protein
MTSETPEETMRKFDTLWAELEVEVVADLERHGNDWLPWYEKFKNYQPQNPYDYPAYLAGDRVSEITTAIGRLIGHEHMTHVWWQRLLPFMMTLRKRGRN